MGGNLSIFLGERDRERKRERQMPAPSTKERL